MATDQPSATSQRKPSQQIVSEELSRLAFHLHQMVNQYGQPDWSADEFLEGLADIAEQLEVLAPKVMLPSAASETHLAADEPMVCIPRALAAFVRKVWLPANPNKLRNCHPSTILNAKRFIAAVEQAHLKDGADFHASVCKATENPHG